MNLSNPKTAHSKPVSIDISKSHMDANIENWQVPGSGHQPIYGTTHVPPSGIPPKGVMLICHGFKGYKDYGFIPQLAQAAANRGLIAHRFNFSHSGVTQEYDTFARADLFEQDTWGKQIDDLQMVARACTAGKLPGGSNPRLPMVWFGHSRGGVTVLLTAAHVFNGEGQEDTPRPVGLVTAAAPMHGLSLAPEQAHRLRQRGYLESPSSRTGQVLRIGKIWLEEIETNPKAFDPLAAISRIGCPVMLLHGDADTTVSVEDSRGLAIAAGDNATLRILAGASHTFNAPNPLPLRDTPPPLTGLMIDAVCDFARGRC